MLKFILAAFAFLLCFVAGYADVYVTAPGGGAAGGYVFTAAAGGVAGGRGADGGDISSIVGATVKGLLKFTCNFAKSPTECGFEEQAKVPGRATIVNAGRDGGTAVRLQTRPGDSHVAGSGAMERNDLWLSQSDTGCYEGREQVWEHSILFPDDFLIPTWHMYVVFDFHNFPNTGGQANFHVNFENGVLIFRGYGGATQNGGEYKATIGAVTKNVWYDFVYHVKWSSGSDGFFKAWVNGVRKLDHRGPTLYRGQGCYLKLANYHTPVCDPYPGCTGRASSVIHSRVIRYDVIP